MTIKVEVFTVFEDYRFGRKFESRFYDDEVAEFVLKDMIVFTTQEYIFQSRRLTSLRTF